MSKFESRSPGPCSLLLLLLIPICVFAMSLDSNGKVLCLDGTAATNNDPQLCAENLCTTARPYMCPNGFCMINQESCALTSNCPVERPFICPNLICASDPSNCAGYPAFKFRPPFVKLSASSNLTLAYQDATMEIGVAWTESLVTDPDFVVAVSPISDDEALRCTLLTDNSDQAIAIRLAVQPIAYSASYEFNPLMIMMSPIVNVSTLSGAGFPTNIDISLQINPHFDYSSYRLATIGVEQMLIWADLSTPLTLGYTATGKPKMTFRVKKSAIYVILFFPNVLAEGFYSYMDCGWACEFPREFMMVFFSAIYMSLVVSMTFWCVAVQTEQRRLDRKKDIKKQRRLQEIVQSQDDAGDHDNAKDHKEENPPESSLSLVKAVEIVKVDKDEEKKSRPSSPSNPANYSFAGPERADSPQAKKEDGHSGVVIPDSLLVGLDKLEPESKLAEDIIGAENNKVEKAVPQSEVLPPQPTILEPRAQSSIEKAGLVSEPEDIDTEKPERKAEGTPINTADDADIIGESARSQRDVVGIKATESISASALIGLAKIGTGPKQGEDKILQRMG